MSCNYFNDDVSRDPTLIVGQIVCSNMMYISYIYTKKWIEC